MLILIIIIIIIIVMYMYDIIWFSKDEQKIEKQTQTKEGEQKKNCCYFAGFMGMCCVPEEAGNAHQNWELVWFINFIQ